VSLEQSLISVHGSQSDSLTLSEPSQGHMKVRVQSCLFTRFLVIKGVKYPKQYCVCIRKQYVRGQIQITKPPFN